MNKKAFLTEPVSAIIQCKSSLKYKDSGCPTISIMIGGTIVEKALLDMGASVNLLPYSIYKQLGLGELKPTSITLSDSPWVSPTQVVPKKSGITVVGNEKGEEVATCLTSGWRVCIDYRKSNVVTRNDHFPLSFIDQVLERVLGHPFYCFLEDYFGYFQI